MNDSPSEEKIDRRKRRTRALLRQALMSLIVEKGFDAVSVQDITDRADVSRATFYLHFRDKEDLLTRSMREVYDELAESAKLQHDHENAIRCVLQGDHSEFYDATDFRHVAEHADFYRVLLSENGVAAYEVMVRQFLARMLETHVAAPARQMGVEPLVPPDMLAYAIAGAEIGVIDWWLNKGREHTPEAMARMFYLVAGFGLWRMLGFKDVTLPEDAQPAP